MCIRDRVGTGGIIQGKSFEPGEIILKTCRRQQVLKPFADQRIFDATDDFTVQVRLLPADAKRIIIFFLLVADTETGIGVPIAVFKIITQLVVCLLYTSRGV